MKDVKKKNEMPLKHETYKGTFTDYRGMSRDFTMVAVSIPVKEDIAVFETHLAFDIEAENDCREIHTFNYNSLKNYPKTTQASICEPIEMQSRISPVRKMLAIGVAVRCNRDKDLGLGEYIAYGKALRNAGSGTGHVMFVSHGGMINTKMVRALLEQEAEHFAKDPGSYIKGYNIDRDRYLKTGHIAMAELTTEEYNSRIGSGTVTAMKQETIEYNSAKVLNEKETTPKTYGSSVTTNTGTSVPVVDDTSELPDVEPDIPEDAGTTLASAKTLSPMQQRLRRFNNG